MIQTAEDIAALHLLNAGLGGIQVIKVIKENRMTEQTQAPADFAGGEENEGWAQATGATAPTASYPEYPYSLADHVYTWSPKLPDGSMLVIRSQTADGLVDAVVNMAPLAGRLKAAWQGVVGQPQAAMPPQGGVNYNPQTPPPNQPFPGQPAWQQAGAPAAPPQQQWAPPAQQGAQVPQGWYRLNVPFKPQGANPGKPGFDGLVAQYGFKKGDPFQGGQVSFQKAVKAWYCAPEIAQAFAQFNPVVAQ